MATFTIGDRPSEKMKKEAFIPVLNEDDVEKAYSLADEIYAQLSYLSPYLRSLALKRMRDKLKDLHMEQTHALRMKADELQRELEWMQDEPNY